MGSKEVLNVLRKYQSPNDVKSFQVILATLSLFISNIAVAHFVYDTYPLILVLTLPISVVCLCRVFYLLHDAGHNALFSRRLFNNVVGNILGFINMIPLDLWKYIHNQHHGSTAKLCAREINPELMTWTIKEYNEATIVQKTVYVLARSAFTQIVLVPLVIFLVTKIPIQKHSFRSNVSVLIYDIVYGLILYSIIKYNVIDEFMMFYFLPLFFVQIYASMIFYLQHQFDGTIWMKNEDWNMYDAAVKGSSYLKFNVFWEWLTGNIGYHHIHHLNPRIPYYNLKDAHIEIKKEMTYTEVYFKDFFKHTKLKLWDDREKRLVSFKEVKNK